MTGGIEDWQLSASSVSDEPTCQVKYARLHQPGRHAWCAKSKEVGESHWILIDLGVTTIVTGLLLQGRGDEEEWITSFSLAMSQDAFKWDFVQDPYGKKKVERKRFNFLQKLEKIDGPVLRLKERRLFSLFEIILLFTSLNTQEVEFVFV